MSASDDRGTRSRGGLTELWCEVERRTGVHVPRFRQGCIEAVEYDPDRRALLLRHRKFLRDEVVAVLDDSDDRDERRAGEAPPEREKATPDIDRERLIGLRLIRARWQSKDRRAVRGERQ